MGVTVKEKVKGSGEWWIFINHHGKRKSKKIGKDEKKALDVAEKIKAKLVLGEMDIDTKSDKIPTFKEYSELWLNTYIKAIRRSSTYERYRDALKKHVYPTLGKKRITEIKRGEVRNLLLKLHGGGLSKSMISIIYATISGPLGYALDEEMIAANPVTGLTKRLHLKARDNQDVRYMTREESELFLTTCRKHYKDYYPLFLCALRTGMRLGEVLGLQWGDIDWNGQFIEVKRSYKRQVMGPTKTGRTRRVDMSNQLTETLRGLYRKRHEEAISNGTGKVVEAIFHHEGIPTAQNSVRYIFKRVLRSAKLRDMRIHDLRHTYASLLLSDGVSPVYVKEQLGHTSIQMTVDIYGHLIPGDNRDTVNRLDTHPDAPYTHPAKKEGAQHYEIAPHSYYMVPKPGFEPGQAFAY